MKVKYIDVLDFKSSVLHRSFMKNIFLEKIQTNVNQRKHIHNNVLSEVLKSKILTIKIGVIFCIKTHFSLRG